MIYSSKNEAPNVLEYPARAQPAPAPARWVLGITGSLWLPRLYKLLDLTCLCNPPLPLHVPMLLRQQQVRAAVCFLPSFALLACGSRGEDSGFRPRPGPARPGRPRGAQLSGGL